MRMLTSESVFSFPRPPGRSPAARADPVGCLVLREHVASCGDAAVYPALVTAAEGRRYRPPAAGCAAGLPLSAGASARQRMFRSSAVVA
jgi:hypothetical protein